METVTLRQANHADERTIFEWRNDPWIIARGISQRTVTWEEHQAWFRKTLKESRVRIFIIECNGQPVGQVRFQRVETEEAEVTVYLLKEYTGRGLGVNAMRLGCAAAFEEWDLLRILARILHDNRESQKAFQKAGFRRCDTNENEGYLTMALERNR